MAAAWVTPGKVERASSRMKTYLDTNVWDSLAEAWSATDLASSLRGLNCEVALGTHVIYESARAFLDPKWHEVARRRFSLLAELAETGTLDFLPDGASLRRNEFERASTGVWIPALVSPLNRASTKQALYKLANGSADEAESFIRNREAFHAAARPITVAQAFAESGLKGKTTLSFQDYERCARASGPSMLLHQARMDGRQITRAVARRVVDRPSEYPVLSAWLGCILHLTWIAGREGISPAPSRFDDYRHVIESAACGLFVSGDLRLLKLTPVLSPFRPCEDSIAWKARLTAPPESP
jgi:hypothetical protein